MDLYYECIPRTFNVSLIERPAIRPSLLRHHHITFNFSCELRCFNWVQNLDSTWRELIREDAPGITDTSAKLIVEDLFSCEEIEEKVEKEVERALMYLTLSEEERQQLIDRALEEVDEAVRTEPLCRSEFRTNMDVEFLLILQHDHVFYSRDEIGQFRRVSCCGSIGSIVEEIDDDFKDIITENCCCICLEDFSDDGEGCEAMEQLICEHVFHSGCIREWLRTSNKCPLCRVETSIKELDCIREVDDFLINS